MDLLDALREHRLLAIVSVVGDPDELAIVSPEHTDDPAKQASAILDLGVEEPAVPVRAVVLGAFAVSNVGDWEGLPNRSELDLLAAPPGSTLR